jgi:hypothetical protein
MTAATTQRPARLHQTSWELLAANGGNTNRAAVSTVA